MQGKVVAQGFRLLVLLTLLMALPLTGGWITLYVLGGIVLVLAGLCCCNCCCSGCCSCDCDPCAGCEACGDCGCDCGDCGCGDCDCGGCGDCGCDGCCAQASLADQALAMGPMALTVPALRMAYLDAMVRHHPDTPAYKADTIPVAGLRFCIGCFVTYPVFLIASAVLIAAPPPWTAAIAAGAGLSAAQVISAVGWTRTRTLKLAVKTSLGIGLALLVRGVLDAPVSVWWQAAILLGLLVVAGLSAVPRAVRMRCGCARSSQRD